LLKNGSDAHKGTYTCKANSAAGNALQDVNVQLISEFIIFLVRFLAKKI